MKQKKIVLFSSLFIFGVMLGMIGLYAVNSIAVVPENSVNSQTGLTWNGRACVQVERADGTLEPTYCNHNLLYNSGANAIRDRLGSAGAGAMIDIALCNATNLTGSRSPAAGDVLKSSTLSSGCELIQTCGLANISGTYGVLGSGNGNMSIYNQFTSTCSGLNVNVTKLRNSSGTNIAGLEFTQASLNNGDKITINWTVYIT